MRRLVLQLALLGLFFATSGCYATKIVTVPLRVVGAVASAVPFVGNSAHDAVDTAADAVDGVAD